MTQEEIIEGNKLIAEFMGFIYKHNKDIWRSGYNLESVDFYCDIDIPNIESFKDSSHELIGTIQNNSIRVGKYGQSDFYSHIIWFETISKAIPVTLSGFNERFCKYHSSWDWLMPVVKKAWGITSEFQYDDKEYLYITEEIFYPDSTLSEFMNNNITDIWRRVVEFIKWYNKSNDKTKTSTKITV